MRGLMALGVSTRSSRVVQCIPRSEGSANSATESAGGKKTRDYMSAGLKRPTRIVSKRDAWLTRGPSGISKGVQESTSRRL